MNPEQVSPDAGDVQDAVSGRDRARALWLAGGMLVFCLAATYAAWWEARDRDLAEAQSHFDQQGREIVFKLSERLQAYSQILRGGAGLVSASDAVSRQEWQRYVTQLDLNRQYPGIQGVGYAAWLTPAAVGRHEARVRADGLATYAVRPAGARPAYVPVTYLEPMTWRNERALGFDMYSEPMRRMAMDHAVEAADIGLTGRVTLVQETMEEPQPGFLMYFPIYVRTPAPMNVEERRARIVGFAYAPFRMLDLMGVVLSRGYEGIAVRITDDSGRAGGQGLLFDSRREAAASPFAMRESIHFGGHTWHLELRGTPAFAAGISRARSNLLLGSGLLLSLVFTLLTWSLASARGRAEVRARAITEALRASQGGIEAANSKLRAVLDASTEVAFIATDTAGLVTTFNRGAEKMLGYAAEEMVGRQTLALIHDPGEVAARGAELTAQLGQAVAGFEVFVTVPRLRGAEQREWTYVRKDGSTLKVSLVVTAVRDAAGEITGYLGVALDVTERRRAEARLRQLLEAVRQSPVSIVITDPRGNIEYVNPKFERLTGYTLAEIAGQNPRVLKSGETPPEQYASMWETVLAGGEWQGEFHNRKKNGELYWERAAISAIMDREGQVTHLLAVKEDITERKHITAEIERHRHHLQELVREQTEGLLQAKEAAERATLAKSEFLANMSHELRTPMHAILSFARLGHGKSGGDEKLHGYFERIGQSGERLLGLLDNLLDLSKLEAGHMALDVGRHDLAALVREVAAELEPLMVARRIAFAQAGGPALAAVDAARFGQVVRNLLANAIKFTPEGRRIAVGFAPGLLAAGRRATDHGELDAVTMRVSDEGIGIPETELESVFDKFVQSSKTKSGAGGTGLGLAICREIVEAHRGTIHAERNAAGGADFVVVLAVAPHPLLATTNVPEPAEELQP